MPAKAAGEPNFWRGVRIGHPLFLDQQPFRKERSGKRKALARLRNTKAVCRKSQTLLGRDGRFVNIRGGIFDVDGTLLDSMDIWDHLGETYLRSIGYEPKETLSEVFQNMSLLQAARYYQTEYGVLLGLEEIMAGVNAILERYYRYEAPLKPGAAELLQRLRRKGVKLCIATASDRYLVEAALKRCGVLSYFGKIFTCTEVGCGKDKPNIFEEALRFLGTEKAETLVFEDSLYALRTAKAAGFPVAAIYDAHEKSQAEVGRLADFYLGNLAQFR